MVPWLEVIKAFAAVFTARVAWVALKNWSRQDRAKREMEFVDALIEDVHEFVTKFGEPLAHIEMDRAGFRGWQPIGNEDPVLGMLAYIEARGRESGKRLQERLQSVSPSVTTLRSRLAKGQMFRFDGYGVYLTKIENMARQFDVATALAALMQSNLNLENPEVMDLMGKYHRETEPSVIREHVQGGSAAVLEFGKARYASTYLV